MSEIKTGFNPVYTSTSKLLILGSFPSVKSRELEFYYGNPRNRFWQTLCSYFAVDTPKTVIDKINFLKERDIAVWDVVDKCEIVGSQDSSIKNYSVVDIYKVLKNSPIKLIILNGATAHKIFCKHYKDINVPFIKLPSTSPANFKFSEGEWHNALSKVFE